MEPAQNYTKRLLELGDWPDGHNVVSSERVASVLGGLGLFAASLLTGSKLAIALAAVAGGGLVARGVTGHCAFYRMLRINTAHPVLAGFAEEPDAAEARLDDTLDDSFPASDPPAHY